MLGRCLSPRRDTTRASGTTMPSFASTTSTRPTSCHTCFHRATSSVHFAGPGCGNGSKPSDGKRHAATMAPSTSRASRGLLRRRSGSSRLCSKRATLWRKLAATTPSLPLRRWRQRKSDCHQVVLALLRCPALCVTFLALSSRPVQLGASHRFTSLIQMSNSRLGKAWTRLGVSTPTGSPFSRTRFCCRSTHLRRFTSLREKFLPRPTQPWHRKTSQLPSTRKLCSRQLPDAHSTFPTTVSTRLQFSFKAPRPTEHNGASDCTTGTAKATTRRPVRLVESAWLPLSPRKSMHMPKKSSYTVRVRAFATSTSSTARMTPCSTHCSSRWANVAGTSATTCL